MARRWFTVATTLALLGRPAAAQRPSDLPLTEIVAKQQSHLFAILLTGDGGWAALDAGVARVLADAGVSVVGWNQRTYLWSRKTPEQTATDLGRLIEYYHHTWQRDSVLVIGYSRGAGTAPFALNRLAAAERARVAGLVLIGAGHGAGFLFHLSDVLRETPAPDDLPVFPEMQKLGTLPLLCVYGENEADTLCPELQPPARLLKLKGGHHFDGAYAEIGQRIVDSFVRRPTSRAP